MKLNRTYRDEFGRQSFASHVCEHCDGSTVIRRDPLRGNVCKHCDTILDEMLREGRFTPQRTAAHSAAAQ